MEHAEKAAQHKVSSSSRPVLGLQVNVLPAMLS
jgi:hypothetical protein